VLKVTAHRACPGVPRAPREACLPWTRPTGCGTGSFKRLPHADGSCKTRSDRRTFQRSSPPQSSGNLMWEAFSDIWMYDGAVLTMIVAGCGPCVHVLDRAKDARLLK